jgi:hypothetical protein
VSERIGEPGEKESVIPPDIRPRDPAFVRSNTLAAPILAAVLHALFVYFPDFFKPGFIFGLIVFPPFTALSWGLYLWARGKKLTGDQEADTRTIMDTTAAYLLFQTICAPVGSMMFFVWSLHALVWGGVLGSVGYALLVLTYLAILVGSVFVFPEWYLRLEADSLSAKPRSALGRLLSPQLPVPRPAVVAGPVVVLAVLLRALASNTWQAAIVASGWLAVAFALMIPSATSLHRFRRLWRIRKELSATTK